MNNACRLLPHLHAQDGFASRGVLVGKGGLLEGRDLLPLADGFSVCVEDQFHVGRVAEGRLGIAAPAVLRNALI